MQDGSDHGLLGHYVHGDLHDGNVLVTDVQRDRVEGAEPKTVEMQFLIHDFGGSRKEAVWTDARKLSDPLMFLGMWRGFVRSRK